MVQVVLTMHTACWTIQVSAFWLNIFLTELVSILSYVYAAVWAATSQLHEHSLSGTQSWTAKPKYKQTNRADCVQDPTRTGPATEQRTWHSYHMCPYHLLLSTSSWFLGSKMNLPWSHKICGAITAVYCASTKTAGVRKAQQATIAAHVATSFWQHACRAWGQCMRTDK